MTHIAPRIDGPCSLADVQGRLRIGLTDWSNAAHRVVDAAASIQPGAKWGTEMKRLSVPAPDGKSSQKLTEVINICATMKRLLDALEWANGLPLSENPVLLVHPSTSSQKASSRVGVVDNDLVLELESGRLAIFEVSDVVSGTDGNDKELKDLTSLGVLSVVNRSVQPASECPDADLYLVVSAEFAPRLGARGKSSWRTSGWFNYEEAGVQHDTHIIRVRPGSIQIRQGWPTSVDVSRKGL